MASNRESTGGRLLRGALYGGLIGCALGAVLYFILRGAASQILSQNLPPTTTDVVKNALVFGGIGIFMGFLSQIGSKPKKDDSGVDPETDRKLREQAAKEARRS